MEFIRYMNTIYCSNDQVENGCSLPVASGAMFKDPEYQKKKLCEVKSSFLLVPDLL